MAKIVSRRKTRNNNPKNIVDRKILILKFLSIWNDLRINDKKKKEYGIHKKRNLSWPVAYRINTNLHNPEEAFRHQFGIKTIGDEKNRQEIMAKGTMYDALDSLEKEKKIIQDTKKGGRQVVIIPTKVGLDIYNQVFNSKDLQSTMGVNL